AAALELLAYQELHPRPGPGHRRLLERAHAAEVRLHQLPPGHPPRPRPGLHRTVLLRALRLRLPRRDRRERAVHPPGAELGAGRDRLSPRPETPVRRRTP